MHNAVNLLEAPSISMGQHAHEVTNVDDNSKCKAMKICEEEEAYCI